MLLRKNLKKTDSQKSWFLKLGICSKYSVESFLPTDQGENRENWKNI